MQPRRWPAEIITIAASYAGYDDAARLAQLIGNLHALLRVHFAYEDSVLYPTMIKCSDAKAAATAAEFEAEMGQLAVQFEEFARRWSTAHAIAESYECFREQSIVILGALGARIERENDLLYPLVHRATGTRAAWSPVRASDAARGARCSTINHAASETLNDTIWSPTEAST
ncbi:MAG TPA: hemerythrin domain-containing protein [Sphingomicrobium sp.]